MLVKPLHPYLVAGVAALLLITVSTTLDATAVESWVEAVLYLAAGGYFGTLVTPDRAHEG